MFLRTISLVKNGSFLGPRWFLNIVGPKLQAIKKLPVVGDMVISMANQLS